MEDDRYRVCGIGVGKKGDGSDMGWVWLGSKCAIIRLALDKLCLVIYDDPDESGHGQLRNPTAKGFTDTSESNRADPLKVDGGAVIAHISVLFPATAARHQGHRDEDRKLLSVCVSS